MAETGDKIAERDPYLGPVLEFHRALYGHNDVNPLIDRAAAFTRLRLMTEELGELACAMHEGDIVLTADALADLLYVVFGTCAVFGIPAMECYRAVHESNMTKDFPSGVDTGRKGARKGERYRPPDLEPILRGAGLID